ncbi:MAG: hypothetical protein XD50_0291 [Clostridia bacterium 41_269]|nr:MAG: hypothetical protein XD50_0291 [Clostridia bacterium 41_269]
MRTIDMKPNGHEATVEFQEDWAMDGAKIYNIITKKLMAAEPKYYTLTANYTVWYRYKYTVKVNGKRRTRYGTGTESGMVTGKLLVNGTGVDSLSQ